MNAQTAAEETAEVLVARIEAVVGSSQLLGAYLYGSLVSGDFVEGSSDIDVLTLLDSALDTPTLKALARLHSTFALDFPDWSDRVEVQYVPAESMRNFKAADMEIAVISPGEPFHAIRAGIGWTQNWFDVRENGRVLRGPDPTLVIPRISVDEFVASIRTYVEEHEVRARSMSLRRGTQAYAILTMCRALYTCSTGMQISKGEAAIWAKNKLPGHSSLIEWATSVRSGTRADRSIEDARTRELARAFVLETAARILREPARHFEAAN